MYYSDLTGNIDFRQLSEASAVSGCMAFRGCSPGSTEEQCHGFEEKSNLNTYASTFDLLSLTIVQVS